MDDLVRLDAHGRRAWKRSRGVILEALACYDRHGGLPNSAWFSFDKKDNARALSRLLREATKILGNTRLSDQREVLEELDAGARSKREEMLRHRSESVGAPDKGAWRRASRSDHLARALCAKHDIKKLQGQREKLVEQMAEELRAMGLQLSSDQVQAILLSISGDDIASLVSLFHNVRQITAQLQALMEEDEQDTFTAKRYYGMYVVLLQILVFAHEQFLQRLEREYLPRLEWIEDENEEQRRTTLRLLHGARDKRDEREKQTLQANLKSQGVTHRVVQVYRQFLQHQRQMTMDTLEGLDRRLEVATNTYRTAEIASNLVELIRMSVQDLAALQSMRVPELVSFENAELASKFQAITARMRALPRS
jgi:hypothetical protein